MQNLKITLILVVLFSSFAAMAEGLPLLATETEGKIYANIPFIRGGNFHEFAAELSLTRAQARAQLLNEFGSLLFPLAMSTPDITGLAMVLGRIIKDFDILVRKHADAAHDRIPESLSHIVMAEYDELFEIHRISPHMHSGRFYAGSKNPNEMIKQMRFIAYGSYTVISGGQVKATLTLEEVFNGKTKSFTASGRLNDAAKILAQKLFDFFQSNRYPEWINPNPDLEWIAPPAPDRPMLATTARRYCQGQQARVPFAEELIQADLGGNYRQGGVRLIKNRFYVVADRGRSVDQYYYNTFAYANTQTGGPVHTDAGHGRIQAHIWCVKGMPGKNIRLVQSIYRLIRKYNGQSKVTAALEFLLVHLQDYSMRDWAAGDFLSVDAAVAELNHHGIQVEVPTY